ncbi:MAG: cell wall hydrolase/autolysin [Vampirovibrio sp.]|jgi:N-acetylmuramoyl-L-alanine amidase|nr:cell wall hydrolase/autolysin [Vampirovibrio sp.]
MSQAIGAETRIRVVYPKPEQQIFEDSTFLMGGVTGLPVGARLWVNGQPVPISPQGFFAWKIPVHAGLTPVKIEVRREESTPPLAQELFALYGVLPLLVLPAMPLAIHEETLTPAEDIWLTKVDMLTVACSASVDAEVSLTIPGLLEQSRRLMPIQSESSYVDTRETIFAERHWVSPRIPVAGYYQASIPIRELMAASGPQTTPRALPLVLHLRHGQASLDKTLPGTLTLLDAPRQAIIREDWAVTRTAPVNGARLTPQREGTRVQIDGLRQGWVRVRLSPEESFYVSLEALDFGVGVPEGGRPQALAFVKSEVVSASMSRVRLAFGDALPYACPIQLESVPSERMNRLHVRLYGVCSHCDFIQYPPDDGVIRQLHWRQVAEHVLELWIDLHRPLCGYDYAWENGELHVTVKSLPARLADIKVLIDPGHGGQETGSTGLNGLPEKDLNLTISRLLRDALLKEGFQVQLTRNADQDLSLPQRGQAVLNAQADMVLSIHHNALPDGRDPLKAEGASCFYYHAFAKPVADALLAGLTDNRGSCFTVPNYGLFYDSLYMTRIHQAVAVLVEIGFFTNPAEFERLIDSAFQQEAAQRLASALRTYCANVLPSA